MNCEKRMAGMYCPNVPVGVELYVRLDATVVCTFAVDDEVTDDDVVSGRISSTPVALSPPVPMPKKVVRMSSRAIVSPGAIWMVVVCPDCVPSVPDRVKLRSYFCVVAEVLATRTSDSKSELFCPVA